MVEIYVRKRVRNPSGTLFVTFLLGLAIGFTVGYVLFGGKGPGLTQPTTEQARKAAETPESSNQQKAPESPGSTPTETKAEVVQEPRGFWPGRLVFLTINGKTLDSATKKLLEEIKPAGVLLRSENLSDENQISLLTRQIKTVFAGPASSEAPLIAADEADVERALQLKVAAPAELGKGKSAEKAREAGRIVGEAALAHGIEVILGPFLNVPIDKKKPADDPRLFSANQELTAVMGLAYVDGLRDGGVIPVVREYPVLNSVKSLDVDRPRLAELMYPFAEAAARNVPGMLVGHVAVPLLDKQDPTRPAALSPVLVKRVLRELPDWKYQGVVLADDLSTVGLPPEKAIVDALAAGCDAALVVTPDADKAFAACIAIERAIADKVLDEKVLLAGAERISSWKEKLGSRATIEDLAAESPKEETKAQAPENISQPEPEKEPEPPAAPVETPASAPAESAPEPKAASAPAEPEPVPAEPAPAPAEPTPEPKPAPPPTETAPAPEAATQSVAAPEPIQPPSEMPPEPEEKPATPPTEQKTEQSPAAAPPETPPAAAAPAAEKTPPAVVPAEPVEEKKLIPAPQPPNTEKVVHEVVTGDTLTRICNKYGVKQSSVLDWNAMKDSTVVLGTKLIIYQPVEPKKAGE